MALDAAWLINVLLTALVGIFCWVLLYILSTVREQFKDIWTTISRLREQLHSTENKLGILEEQVKIFSRKCNK